MFAEKLYLYTGVYLDYGLNNIYEEINPAQPFVEHNSESPRDFTINSIIRSEYIQNGVSQSFTDKVTPIAAGLTLQLSLGLGNMEGKAKTAKPEDKVLTETKPVETVPSSEAAACKAEEEAARKAEEARLAKKEATRKAAKNQRLAQEAENLSKAEASVQKPVENYSLAQVELTEDHKTELDDKIALLKKYPNLKIFIYGHTCDIGTAAANEKVGLARAEKAKEYLLSNGIQENSITGIASKRDTEPLVPNTS